MFSCKNFGRKYHFFSIRNVADVNRSNKNAKNFDAVDHLRKHRVDVGHLMKTHAETFSVVGQNVVRHHTFAQNLFLICA